MESKDFLSLFAGKQILVSKPDKEASELMTRHYHELSDKYLKFLSERDTESQCGSFFTVNELDRSLDPSKDRTKLMWIRSRAVWADDDEPRETPRTDWPIKPSLIVETSPKKFHYYWLTSTENADEWLAVMRGLARTYNTDTAVCDLARIMRIPGFHHNKREPFLSSVVGGHCEQIPWGDILEAFPPLIEQSTGELSTATEFSEEEAIRQILTAENFHQSFTSIAMSKANFTLDQNLIIGYIESLMMKARYQYDMPAERIPRWETAMAGVEIKEAVTSAIKIVKNEIIIERPLEELSLSANEEFVRGNRLPDHILIPPNTKIGELTSALLNTWWIPNKMIAAMTARHIVCYLAGGNYRSNIGDRVNIQQIAIGESGCGKDLLIGGTTKTLQLAFEDNMEILKQVLNGIVDEAGSAEGLDDKIRGLGHKHDIIFLRDEIGELLQGASAGNQHKMGIMNYALKMYTKSDTVSNERVKAKQKGGEESQILYAPHFIISGATTPNLIVQGLSADNVATGAMSRMMFFNADLYKMERLRVREELALSGEMIENFYQIHSTIMMTGQLHTMPSARIYNPKIVVFPPEVVELCYQESLRDDARSGGFKAVWNRRVPNAKKYAMIEAILENPCEPIVTMEMMKRNLIFVETSCGYTIDLFSNSVGHGLYDVAIKKVLRKMNEYPDRWWKRAEMINVHPVVSMNKNDKNGIVQELVENNYVDFAESSNSHGKPTKNYRITEIGRILLASG